jgi:hypothetical protein
MQAASQATDDALEDEIGFLIDGFESDDSLGNSTIGAMLLFSDATFRARMATVRLPATIDMSSIMLRALHVPTVCQAGCVAPCLGAWQSAPFLNKALLQSQAYKELLTAVASVRWRPCSVASSQALIKQPQGISQLACAHALLAHCNAQAADPKQAAQSNTVCSGVICAGLARLLRQRLYLQVSANEGHARSVDTAAARGGITTMVPTVCRLPLTLRNLHDLLELVLECHPFPVAQPAGPKPRL